MEKQTLFEKLYIRTKVPKCKNCGVFLGYPINPMRKSFCSDKCYKEKNAKDSIIRTKQLRELNKELGRCTHCGGDKEDKNYAMCEKCREYHKHYQRKYPRIKKENNSFNVKQNKEMKGGYYKMEETIDMNDIKVLRNTRTELNDVSDLMTDIRENGLLEPIGVWESKGEYIVAYGHRRFDALKKLGRKNLVLGKEINVLSKKMTEQDFLILNLSENLHRSDNSPLELGKGCKQLLELGLNISEISSRLSIPRTRIETALTLLQRVPKELRVGIGYGMENKKRGNLTATIANKIATLRAKKSETDQLFKLAKDKEFSISDIDFLARVMNNEGTNLTDALKAKEKYVNKQVNFTVSKEVLEEIKKNGAHFAVIVKKIIKGEEKPIKNLLY